MDAYFIHASLSQQMIRQGLPGQMVDAVCHAMTCGGVICDSYYDPARIADYCGSIDV
jgi:hypothetical protein